ncbi:MAG: DUF362 domain-containing protein [Candidatus Aminicenantes bacterium]|nr:DUF362 domain-containing protein [Candidatus Aminicenantes bacterium]
MDNKVYAISCNNYEETYEKIKILMDSMGGMNGFVQADETIIVKPNLLLPADPDKAVTTHPNVVTAVLELVTDSGAKPLIADSAGSGYSHTEKTLRHLYEKCGIKEAALKTGAELNYDTTFKIVPFPEGKLIKRFEIITPVFQADGLINLCKLKTHGFMSMTGAVKNLFGVIPGRTKPGYHAKLDHPDRFAAMLLDLAEYISPRLSIMDAVIGMEGNGPSGGNPKKAGFLLAAANPLALDVVAGEMMGLRKKDNPILAEAERRGLKPIDPDDIDLVGADFKDLRVSGFMLPKTIVKGSGFGIPSVLGNLVRSLLVKAATLKPVINRNKCTACGACRDACPVKVITIVDNRYARIDPKNCIRCYCCHEMCQFDAIELRGSRFFNLISR